MSTKALMTGVPSGMRGSADLVPLVEAREEAAS